MSETTPWEAMLDGLRQAGDAVFGSHDLSPLDRAEGLRFLTRLTSVCFDMFLEYGDPQRPAFVRLMGPHRKFFGDNPDASYDYAVLDGTRSYRITGHRRTSEYLACCVYGRDANGVSTIVANLSDRDLTLDPSGSFALYLSATPPADASLGEWIKLTEDVENTVVRQYHLDAASEIEATYSIECLDDADPSEPSQTDRSMRSAAKFLSDGARFTAGAAEFIGSAPNEITIDSERASVAAFYPTPDNKYLAGWFKLADDEALVIAGQPPNARYWSLLVMNRWMESLDVGPNPSLLNKSAVALEPDGSFRIVIAHRDPGVANWLDPAGHPEGYFMFRWMQADDVVRPALSVVPVDSLRA